MKYKSILSQAYCIVSVFQFNTIKITEKKISVILNALKNNPIFRKNANQMNEKWNNKLIFKNNSISKRMMTPRNNTMARQLHGKRRIQCLLIQVYFCTDTYLTWKECKDRRDCQDKHNRKSISTKIYMWNKVNSLLSLSR